MSLAVDEPILNNPFEEPKGIPGLCGGTEEEFEIIFIKKAFKN